MSFEGWSTTWPAYVRHHAGTVPHTEIAERLGISSSAVGRWFPGAKPKQMRPDPDYVAAFARVYKRPVIEALLAAAYVLPEDVSDDERFVINMGVSPSELTIDELLELVRSRVSDGQPHGRHKVDDIGSRFGRGLRNKGLQKRGKRA